MDFKKKNLYNFFKICICEKNVCISGGLRMKRIAQLTVVVLLISVLFVCATAAETVYVDPTGETAGAYDSLAEAIGALPAEGGAVIIVSDTAMPVKDTVTLPSKSGKVTVTSGNGSALTIGYRLRLGCDMEFDNIKIVNASTSEGAILAAGHTLVIGSGVTTDRTNGSSRWPTLYGGDNDTDASYNTHLVVKGGTWRNIFGGNRNRTLTGNTLVELSNVTFGGNLSAKSEGGTFNGTAELVLDLRGGKTVTGGTFKMAPTSFLVDEGYAAELNGSTYSQVKAKLAVYVDGTGKTEDAYTTLESAIAALANSGGTVIVCGDTTVGDSKTRIDLPQKNGKVTVKGENGAKLKIARGVRLGCEMEFDDIELVNISTSFGYISAMGNKLTIGENVTTSRSGTTRWLSVYGGSDGSEVTEYDSHLVIKAGTYRYIFGGGKGTFKGDSVVEVSGVTVEKKLSYKNEVGTFSGSGTLIVDLRGNKTVTSASFVETPTFRTDAGYTAKLDGTTYSQVKKDDGVLYVDGTGSSGGTYPSLEAAIAALPDSGGEIVIYGDTVVGTDAAPFALPQKSGKVTVTAQNGAKLKIARGIVLGCEMEFDDIEIVNLSVREGFISADGHKLTLGEGVTTSRENTERWLTVLGGNKTSAETDYDTHLVIRAGTYRYIFGGNSTAPFRGHAVVEVANVTVGKLSARNESGAFHGTSELLIDLSGDRTVTAETLPDTPVFVTDDGYRVVHTDDTYSQALAATSPVYVDGTGETSGAYRTLEEAIEVLPNNGGEVIVCGDTTVSAASEPTALSVKNGKITVKGENEAVLTLANGILPGSDLELADITVALADTCDGVYVQGGKTLAVKETVDIRGGKLTVTLGENGTAILDNANVTVTTAITCEIVVNGNIYTAKRISIGFISNASGSDNNDGLSDAAPKKYQGEVGGKGIRNLLYGGGIIVACGDFGISDNQTWDYGGKVTVLGKYRDKDYRDPDANTGIFNLSGGRILTVVSDLTFEDILFYVGNSNTTVRVADGATLTIGENVQFLNATLTVEVAEGGTAILKSGKYTDIKGEGTILVEHCTHPEVSKGIAVIAPTCTSNGGRYDKCKTCGLHIKVIESDSPIDPGAHDIRWTFGTDSATATCANGCGLSVTQVYREVKEIHVSSAGAIDGDFTAANPVNDFGLAMAFAAAQSGDITVYIHDYAVIPDSGVHSSWNAYIEPAHTNTITVRGYKDQAVLRFNNDSESTVLVYALSGPTTFEQLEFSSWGSTEDTAFHFVARHNKLVLGESLSTDLYHKGSNAFNIVGGCFYTELSPEGGCKDLDTDVTILSGNYTHVYAGAYYNGKCCVDTFTQGGSTYNGGDVHLTVGGNMTARREIRVGNHGDSSVYANMNDAYINVIGDVATMRYFAFSPSKDAYRVQNVYLKLYDGEIRVGEELGQMGELGYEWGSAAYGEAVTARIAGKLYVYANSESVSAMGMYTGLVGSLIWDSANDGKWEAIIMDESYCAVSGGAHTPRGNATEHLDATCTAEGYDVYVCADCGKTYAETIDRIPHIYGDVTVLAATCIVPEMEKEVCTVCGDARHTVVGTAYAEHTDPEKTGYCQVCNKDLTADCPHENVTVTPITSGCGNGEKFVCADCGKTEVNITGDGHKYGAYTITVAPTATAAGVKTRTCKVCGKVNTAPVYAQNATDATALAVDASGNLADFSVENTKLSKAEKAVLNELLQQSAYGSEVKVSYETDGEAVLNTVYMLPVPKEYADYENIRVIVREDNGEMHDVYFEIEKGYIVFVF